MLASRVERLKIKHTFEASSHPTCFRTEQYLSAWNPQEPVVGRFSQWTNCGPTMALWGRNLALSKSWGSAAFYWSLQLFSQTEGIWRSQETLVSASASAWRAAQLRSESSVGCYRAMKSQPVGWLPRHQNSSFKSVEFYKIFDPPNGDSTLKIMVFNSPILIGACLMASLRGHLVGNMSNSLKHIFKK